MDQERPSGMTETDKTVLTATIITALVTSVATALIMSAHYSQQPDVVSAPFKEGSVPKDAADKMCYGFGGVSKVRSRERTDHGTYVSESLSVTCKDGTRLILTRDNDG